MRKTPLLIFCALLLCGGLHAKPVDANRARQTATAFLRQAGCAKPDALTDITVQTPYREFYTFSITGGGFVLVSADDCVKPILGYSLTSPFEPEGIPEHVDAWLVEYENEIRYYKERRQPDSAPHPEWDNPTAREEYETAVSPLLTTTWNQGNYYNLLCPTISGSRAPTGCVATATAQVMKFWNHPTRGHGSHSYVLSGTTLSANFDTLYPWTTMPNALGGSSTSAQDNAVSLLMYHVGVAVEMGYGANSSGAQTVNTSGNLHASAQTALVKHFKYSSSLTAVWRNDYPTAEWNSILMTELDAGRPIIHSGRGAGGGHAFVCDGYDNSGQFHFNWGWGGAYDGYFTTGSLNPGVGGIGGNGSGTYNVNNAAIIGIQPATQFGTGGTVSANVSGGTGCSVSGAGTYNFGDTVTVHASASTGFRFKGWANKTRSNPCVFIMTGGNQSLTAQFEPLGSDTISYCGSRSAYVTALGNGSTATWGMKVPVSSLVPNSQLTAVQHYVPEAGTYILNVYEGSTSNLVKTDTVTYAASDEDTWHTITFSSPVTFSGSQPVWISFRSDASYPAALTHGSGNGDGMLWGSSLYSIYGNRNNTFMIRGIFYHPPIPVVYDTATVPYYTGFETADDRGWQLNNATPNGWAIGNATSHSGNSAMYVSNDGGATNAYSGSPTCASFATRTFLLTAGQYNLSFNWKGTGESTWDFMRVFLCPASETPDASFFNTQPLARTGVPSGWTDISGAYLNQRTDWQDTSYLFQMASSGYYKVVFMWYNDNSNAGTAAAIDNVNLEKIVQPATVPYATGFEVADDCDWEYVNSNVNQWTIGSATSQNGSRALYISNDGGTNNAYTNSSATGTSFATRTVTLAAGQYTLAFNWKLKGETDYDFMRVFLSPANATPSAELLGANTTAKRTTVPTGWLDIAAGMLVNQTAWQMASYDFTVATTGDYKLVFMWYNDHGDGENPPAAIDNVSLSTYVQQYTITANANNATMGTVTGGGNYNHGATATLTATAATGYHFVQWNDGNTQNPRTVTVTANATYTATFAINSYTLTANSANASQGSVTGGGNYNHGATATLTATAATGYHFVQWNDGNTQNPRTVTVTANATYTATFAINTYALTVSSADQTMGSVSSSHGSSVEEGTLITLTATPNDGFHFTGWSITPGYTYLVTDNPLSLTVNSDMTIVANFEADPVVPTTYTVTINRMMYEDGSIRPLYNDEENMTWVTGNGTYEEGTTVTVRASNDYPFYFMQWNNAAGQLSSAPEYQFTITSDIELTAIFAPHVGIESDLQPTTSNLYPNPATTSATLSGIEPGSSVTLIDLHGRTLSQSHPPASELTIDLSSLVRGSYFVRIVSPNGTAVHKLIVK